MKLILLIALLCITANSLHFYLIEGKEKCFTDDIPGNTVKIIKYNIFKNI